MFWFKQFFCFGIIRQYLTCLLVLQIMFKGRFWFNAKENKNNKGEMLWNIFSMKRLKWQKKMLNGTLFNGSSNNSASSCTVLGSIGCNQCGEKRVVLSYVFPTQSGKKEFCSEPCLSAYRNAQKGIHTLTIQVGKQKTCVVTFNLLHFFDF